MKSHALYISTILLALVCLTGCKKDEIPTQSLFFPGDCKINSFTYNGLGIRYFVHYNADSTVKGLSVNNDQGTLNYSYEFNKQQLTNGFKIINNRPYLGFKYEYGTEGLELIRLYELDSKEYNIEDSPAQTNEVVQYRFKYGNSGKPISMAASSMIRDSVKNIDVLKPVLSYTYDYDERGNLVTEVYSTLDKEEKMQVIYTSHHQYDDKNNSLRQLYQLFYDQYYSAPYIFSQNNKIATKTVYTSQYTSNVKYNLEYDSDGNVTKNDLHFSYIRWHCP
jgi:hypothetical protein